MPTDTFSLIPWMRKVTHGSSSMPGDVMPGEFRPDDMVQAVNLRVYIRGDWQMNSLNINRIILGGTADIIVDCEDTSGTRFDVDGFPTITITDGEGTTKVSAVSMTREGTGRYVYFYSPASTDLAGMYKAVISADVDSSSGTRTEKVAYIFEVVA